MRISAIFILILGFSAVAFGQGNDLLSSYLSTTSLENEALAQGKVAALIEKLESKKVKSDRQFLRSVFNLTHRQFLREYSQYSEFNDIFKSGRYDCLTATALYSVLLSRLNYPHTIMETNYHIFIMVKTGEGDILIESTDPIKGFEYIPSNIEERINAYRADLGAKNDEGEYYSYGFDLFHEVTPEQLTGLLFFNQSVKAFNSQDWMRAGELLKKAREVYDSPRVGEMESLLSQVTAQVVTESSTRLAQRDQ